MEEVVSKFKQKGELECKKGRRWKIFLLLLTFAFFLRIFLVIYPEVIHNDGAEYIRHAKEVLSGNWMGGKSGPIYPALIALAYTFVKNYELAGIWISVILGALLVIPVFYLGKEIFGERIGEISGLLVAVHPILYIYSGSVLTESTYYFLIATSVLFGWYAFSKGRFYHVLLFSLFASLTYLARPEAIGFLFVFCTWVLLVNPPHRKRNWIKRTGVILLSIFCFFLFSSPYLIQLRKELGKWQLSKKSIISVGSISDEEDTSFEAVVAKEKMNLLGLLKDPVALLGKIGIGFLESFYRFQQVFNPILFLLAILGWMKIFKMKSLHHFKANFYILSHHFFFFAFVFAFFWPHRRYVSHMIPISIPWAAFGCLEVMVWINQWFEKENLRKRVSLILLFLLLGGLFIQGRVIHTREPRVIRKETGLWIKSHLPRDVKIMSRLPQEAFYAELPWIRIPEKNYEEILRVARSNKVRYLIVDGSIEKDSPGFCRKIEEKDLILIKDIRDKDRRMVIFEIVYPE